MKKRNLRGVIVYDNGGKTVDRYTIFIGRDVYGMGRDPFSPLGFNQYTNDASEIPGRKHLGKRLKAQEIPELVKQAILDRKYG